MPRHSAQSSQCASHHTAIEERCSGGGLHRRRQCAGRQHLQAAAASSRRRWRQRARRHVSKPLRCCWLCRRSIVAVLRLPSVLQACLRSSWLHRQLPRLAHRSIARSARFWQHAGATGGRGVPAAPGGLAAGQARSGVGRSGRVLHPALRLQARQRRQGRPGAAGRAAVKPEGAVGGGGGRRRRPAVCLRMCRVPCAPLDLLCTPTHGRSTLTPACILVLPRASHTSRRRRCRWARPPSPGSTSRRAATAWTAWPSLTAPPSGWSCWGPP